MGFYHSSKPLVTARCVALTQGKKVGKHEKWTICTSLAIDHKIEPTNVQTPQVVSFIDTAEWIVMDQIGFE